MMADSKFMFEDLQNICRLCHSKTSLVSIFDTRLEYENMAEVVEVTTGVKISPTDGLSHMLCNKCSHVTIRMFIFRTKSLQNNLELTAKAAKQRAVHKSVKKLFQKYPKITVPTSVTKLNLSPCVIIERDEEAFQKKKDTIKMNRVSIPNKKIIHKTASPSISRRTSPRTDFGIQNNNNRIARVTLHIVENLTLNDDSIIFPSEETSPGKNLRLRRDQIQKVKDQVQKEIIQQGEEEKGSRERKEYLVEKHKDNGNLKLGKGGNDVAHQEEEANIEGKKLNIIRAEKKQQEQFYKAYDSKKLREQEKDEDQNKNDTADKELGDSDKRKTEENMVKMRVEEEPEIQKLDEDVIKKLRQGEKELHAKHEERCHQTLKEKEICRQERETKQLKNEEGDSENVELNDSLFIIKQNFKKMHICNVCNSVFYTLKGLKKHQNLHKRCVLCKGVFTNLEMTREHLKVCSVRKMMNNLPIVKIRRCNEDKHLRKKYKSVFEVLNTSKNLKDTNSADHDRQSTQQCDKNLKGSNEEIDSKQTATNSSNIETMEVEIASQPTPLKKRRNSRYWTQKNVDISEKKDSSTTEKSKAPENLILIPHVTAESSIASENSRIISPTILKNLECDPKPNNKNGSKLVGGTSSINLSSQQIQENIIAHSTDEITCAKIQNIASSSKTFTLLNSDKEASTASSHFNTSINPMENEIMEGDKRKRDGDELWNISKKTKLSDAEKNLVGTPDVLFKGTFSPSLKIVDEDAIVMDKDEEETASLKKLLKKIAVGKNSHCKSILTNVPCNKDIIRSENGDCMFILKNLRNHLIHSNILVNTTFSKSTSLRYASEQTNKLRTYRKPHQASDNPKNVQNETNSNIVIQNSIILKPNCTSIQNQNNNNIEKSAEEPDVDLTENINKKLGEMQKKTEDDCEKTVKIIGYQTAGTGDEIPNRSDGRVDSAEPLKIRISNIESIKPSSNESQDYVMKKQSGKKFVKLQMPIKIRPAPEKTKAATTVTSSNAVCFNSAPKSGSSAVSNTPNYVIGPSGMMCQNELKNQLVYLVDPVSKTLKLVNQTPLNLIYTSPAPNLYLNPTIKIQDRGVLNSNTQPGSSPSGPAQPSLAGDQNTNTQPVFAYPKIPLKRNPKDCMNPVSASCNTQSTKSEDVKYVLRVKNISELM